MAARRGEKTPLSFRDIAFSGETTPLSLRDISPFRGDKLEYPNSHNKFFFHL